MFFQTPLCKSFLFSNQLYLQEQPVLVHEPQYKENYKAVACSKQHWVPTAKKLFRSIKQRGSNATEIDEFTNEIGGYCITTVI